MNWMRIVFVISFAVTQCSSNSFLYSLHRNNEGEEWKKCSYLRTHGMLGVDCSHLELHEIPSNLSSRIEVLDMTRNRIREIYNNSFENYPYLKILYLTDNSIHDIEAGAFAPVPDLEILDLTLNSLQFVPEALESLTSLKKLMMGHNPFIDVSFSKTLPSVQYLSLSSCRLKKLPDFSPLPGLVQLNVTGNKLQTVELTQVAPMCSLKVLDIRKNLRLFRQEYCKCQLFVKWFTNLMEEGFDLFPELGEICKNTTEGKQIITDPDVCFTNETDLILEKSETIRRSCKAEVMKYAWGNLRLKASARWVVIVLASLAVIFVSAFCLYYVRKRQLMINSRNRSSEPLTHEKSLS